MIHADRDFATMQDFIVGRLSDDERRAFEDRLVREPTLVHELERSLRMRAGLEQLRAQGYFTKAAYRGGSSRNWVPALAAAACAGVALFLWLSRDIGPPPILLASLDSQAPADVRSAVAAHFTFVSVRGGAAPDLDLPAAGLIELRAAPSTLETIHRYRVTLLRQEEAGVTAAVADLGGLAVGTDGYVHCYADAARLAPGRYVLRIQPDPDTPGMAEKFPFTLRAHVTGVSG